MSIEVNGNSLKTDDSGYLLEISDWNEGVAQVIADADDLAYTR